MAQVVWTFARRWSRCILPAGLGVLVSCAALPEIDVANSVVGHSLEGRPIRAAVITGVDPVSGAAFSGGEGSPEGAVELETLFFFAGIHGNESLTVPLLERLVDEARARPELVAGKRLVVVTAANPDGLERRSRLNARGVDLNRNFPASNWARRRGVHGGEAASEPETRVLVELVERYRPSRILSVHAPLHCVNFDGPAAGVARAMSEASGYALKPSIGYPTPGSFGSWAGADLRIPVVTLELRRTIRAAELWDELGGAIEAFVRYPLD